MTELFNGRVLIFDTETTDRTDGEIIEAAWLGLADRGGLSLDPYIGAQWQKRYRPTQPISYGAMAVHHILPSDVDGCPPSSSFALPDDIEFLIGHSVDFDWTAAGSPAHVKRIDTHAIAKWLWPDESGYALTALIYMLDGPTPATREMVQNAHSAMADVRMTYRLLQHILALQPVRTWHDLWEYSEECRIPRTCPLKRWEGVLLADMETSAISWCLRQDWIDPYFRKGLEKVLEERGFMRRHIDPRVDFETAW